MSKLPFFSVIISLYNKENHIQDTIDSVLNQTFKDFEVIIVDDGSKDRSVEIVQSFNDKRIVIFEQENQGASATRNKGITHAKAKFIALLDGDDLWDRDYLQEINSAIDQFPETHVFGTAIASKFGDKVVAATYNFKKSGVLISLKDYFKNSLKFSLLTSSSVVFDKDILDKTGRFDLTIKSGQDTDLWIRIGMHYPIVFIDKILSYYVHDVNSLSNTAFSPKDKPRFDKYLEEEKTNPAMKKVIDINRYSMAILSKLEDSPSDFKHFSDALDKRNLTLKQRTFLGSPAWLLRILLFLKSLKGEKLYYRY